MLLLRPDLTTALIRYRRPDHLWLLQEFLWQDYDTAPVFPVLRKFILFWRTKLDGPIHSITVMHALGEKEFRFADHHDTLH